MTAPTDPPSPSLPPSKDLGDGSPIPSSARYHSHSFIACSQTIFIASSCTSIVSLTYYNSSSPHLRTEKVDLALLPSPLHFDKSESYKESYVRARADLLLTYSGFPRSPSSHQRPPGSLAPPWDSTRSATAAAASPTIRGYFESTQRSQGGLLGACQGLQASRRTELTMHSSARRRFFTARRRLRQREQQQYSTVRRWDEE